MIKIKPTKIQDDRKYVATFKIKKTGDLIYWRYKTPAGAENTAKQEAERWELISIEEIK